MISIVIPTYTATEYLRVCLDSIYKNQFYIKNEIIVVVDGTLKATEKLLENYKKLLNLKVIVFDENKGLAFSTNFGFFNSSFPLILNINDDNVVPKDFDKILVEEYLEGTCLTPNQIEPRPSIFKPFIIRNFGETWDEFSLDVFTKEEQLLREELPQTNYGWTFPFFISKDIFLAVGGFDVCYNSPHVIDWEFFVKLDKLRIPSFRTSRCNFYHFGSKTARTPESYQKEQEAHEYFRYKWGFPAYNRLLMT